MLLLQNARQKYSELAEIIATEGSGLQFPARVLFQRNETCQPVAVFIGGFGFDTDREMVGELIVWIFVIRHRAFRIRIDCVSLIEYIASRCFKRNEVRLV